MAGRRSLAIWTATGIGLLLVGVPGKRLDAGDVDRSLSLRWDQEMLTIRGNRLLAEAKTIHGKIDLMPADYIEPRTRDRGDFPGRQRQPTASGASPPAKKLIEFGWDEPDPSFMRGERDQLERSPFDGCVFHITARGAAGATENFAWLCWGRRKFSESELKPAMDDLASIHWTRFRHNFLRFNVTPADLDWFDDYAAVVSNARLAAKVARAGRCQGILLDTEAYQGKLFDFHSQRDAVRRSWADYATQARLRGRQVMIAFQDGFPDLIVFVTFGHSHLWKQSDGGKKPLAECPDGLLVPFLDGMVEAATDKARLIDGHEMSYGYRDPALFAKARDAIKLSAPLLAADPPRYHAVVSAGFGLWLDFNWPKFGWNTAKLEGNYFTPERFESSLRAALSQADEYVWIYTEKPRWWSKGGREVDLPPAYKEAVRAAREINPRK